MEAVTTRSREPSHVAGGERAFEAAQVTFPDLAWDHFHWERRRRTGATERPEAADRYRETRAAFEARYGEVLGEYWSITEPSGVALTRRRPPRLLRPFVDDKLRFHRATDWLTRDAPAVADALSRCETLAVQVTEVLRYASEAIALRRILVVASHLLGFVDRAGGKPPAAEAARVAEEQSRQLQAVEAYYRRAGGRIGRMVYTWGMLVGLGILALLLAVFAIPLWLFGPLEWGDRNVQHFLVSYGAGAIGAFVSVLQRMATEKFVIHYDLGKRSLYALGSYRPILGAVFGLVTYFALASQLLQIQAPEDDRALFFYGSLAFVAGFSERFTKVLVHGVESRFPPARAAGAPAPAGSAASPPDPPPEPDSPAEPPPAAGADEPA